MARANDFYAQRDLRTREFTDADEAKYYRHVHVMASEAIINSRPGQAALLALVNQLARVHRKITTSVPRTHKALLLVPGFTGEITLADELYGIMNKIDPYGDFNFAENPPPGAVSLAIGLDGPAEIFIGANGSIGSVSISPQAFDVEYEGSIRGAALAACLGACAVFRLIFSGERYETSFSIWNFGVGSKADGGPIDLKPVNLDGILVAGAGAILSGLSYWAKIFGDRSSWHIADRDPLEIHNTNRGLTFFPEDTGWFGGDSVLKVQIARRHLDATIYPDWLNKFDFSNQKFDAVLCLANEHGVRYQINFLKAPIFLQATTGKNWQAQLHRHIPLRDDCVFCRTGTLPAQPVFGCSFAEVQTDAGKTDAALPFLSAISSLSLAVSLQRLQAGTVHIGSQNDWSIDVKAAQKPVRQGTRVCKTNCPVTAFWTVASLS